MYGFYGIDIYYIVLVLPAFIFSLYAQFKVKSTFAKYSQIKNLSGLSGAQIADTMLNKNGAGEVLIEQTQGSLTDHYDPRSKIIRLSETVYNSNSVAAIGVAAHETGHALQHKEGYGFVALKTSLVPVANIGSMAGPWLAILGIMFGIPLLAQIGIIAYAIAVLFYFVTLPVEFDASRRATQWLKDSGLFASEDMSGVNKVLRAAAMTYVASAGVALASLLRLVLLTQGNSRNDD